MHYFAVGDIHGMFEAFLTILCRIDEYAHEHKIEEYTVITLGDYIDRGPESNKVVDYLINLERSWAGSSRYLVTLRGNHEQMYLDALNGGSDDVYLFRINGGTQTLQSYGVSMETDVPFSHKQFFRDTKMFYETEKHYFVHAGVYPGVPLDRQSDNARLWIREDFLYSDCDFGKMIVHGHTPKQYDEGTKPNRVNLDYGAVFGGSLVCAVFNDEQKEPLDYLFTDKLSRKG